MSPTHALPATRAHGLPRWGRVVAITVHTTAATSWLALLTAATAVQAASPTHRDIVMEAPGAEWILGVLVVAALCSGWVLAWGTSWGFRRFHWLVTKQVVAAVLVVGGSAAFVVGHHDLWVRGVSLVLLLVVIGLSMVKPGGRTKAGSARFH